MALVAASVLLARAPADAVEGVEVGVAKSKSGPFKAQIRAKVALGEKRNVYVRTKNFASEPKDVTLFAPDEQNDYRVKYFKANGTNINSDVASGGGYAFSLGAEKSKVFRMQIKAKDGTGNECLQANMDTGGFDTFAYVGVNLPPPPFGLHHVSRACICERRGDAP